MGRSWGGASNTSAPNRRKPRPFVRDGRLVRGAVGLRHGAARARRMRPRGRWWPDFTGSMFCAASGPLYEWSTIRPEPLNIGWAQAGMWQGGLHMVWATAPIMKWMGQPSSSGARVIWLGS